MSASPPPVSPARWSGTRTWKAPRSGSAPSERPAGSACQHLMARQQLGRRGSAGVGEGHDPVVVDDVVGQLVLLRSEVAVEQAHAVPGDDRMQLEDDLVDLRSQRGSEAATAAQPDPGAGLLLQLPHRLE